MSNTEPTTNFFKNTETLTRHANTIKRRTWYKDATQDKISRRSIADILDMFCNECYGEDQGIYRNHKYNMTPEQQAWYLDLIKSEYLALLSIKLPHVNQSGYRRTKNQQEAKEMYRNIIRTIERKFTSSEHNWKRNPLPFIGVFEHGKSGFWHVHLAIKHCGEPMYVLRRLIKAIDEAREYFGFFQTVINLRYIYDKEGVCAYMVKELNKNTNNPNVRYIHDEGAYLFCLKTWFGNNVQEKIYPYTPSSLSTLKLWVGFGVILKRNNCLNIPNPINKLRHFCIQKRPQRR